jgi:hypothetical protein
MSVSDLLHALITRKNTCIEIESYGCEWIKDINISLHNRDQGYNWRYKSHSLCRDFNDDHKLAPNVLEVKYMQT